MANENREYAEDALDRYNLVPNDITKQEHDRCKQCAAEHRHLAEWLKELKGYRSIKDQIAFAKRNIRSENSDYLTGYISALSAVEGMIAEVEKAESENVCIW